MTTTTFHGDDVIPAPFTEALFHVIPVPLEKTVSYGTGTAAGPQAILEASCQLELFDGESVPADCGIHTAEALDCSGEISGILTALEKHVAQSAEIRAIPVILGGEHSLTHGCIRGLKHIYGAEFGVIHFDAHADLRDSYEGSKQSHASVMRRVFEEDIPLFQLATRSYCLEEHNFRKENDIPYYDAKTIWSDGIDTVKIPKNFPEKVFISFDIDGLDPSLMPATGTPVPGGLNWHQAMTLLERLLAERICLGFDLVELAPIPMLPCADFTAAQLAYNIMGYITRGKKNRIFFKKILQHAEFMRK